MASTDKKTLVNAAALTADLTTDAQSLDPSNSEFICFLKATAVHADTTVDAKIQHSPNRADWYDLKAFTAIVGVDGSQVIVLNPTTEAVLPNVRAVIDLSGSTLQATVTTELYFKP